MRPANITDPYADHGASQLYDALNTYVLTRDIGVQYEYSNLGFGLLGHLLSLRAGKSCEDILRERVLGPLAMNNTVVNLTPAMQQKVTPGHSATGNVVPNWQLDALAGAVPSSPMLLTC
jgi:CubicO group peptidase (beta-lactamase class C family)